ncbi:hypothetical protein EDB80DRAFT_178465 [Ilyonectria destructans]|nr:hypothetical protein EDB80DRAFT_178465 [Ilyonectria destructans]
MDWPHNNLGLSESDLANVFKYVPRDSTVVRMLAKNQYEPKKELLEDNQWRKWIKYELPKIEDEDSNPGLVLLLATRAGEPSRVSGTELRTPINFESRKDTTFSPLSEKTRTNHDNTAVVTASGRRGVRTLPFSRETFKLISERFYTHSSIARVISRSDVPFFSSDCIQATQPAFVYNCRSSNAWDMDLALSVTHFPESSLTFAIVYGCTVSIEKEIIKRLSLIKEEATHPALMPGIFAELERSRHMRLVQSKIAVLEMTILEVDHQSDDIDTAHRARVDKRNVKKRTTWLDTTYLRNGLLSWSTQLERMIESLTDLELEPSFRRGPIFSRGYDTEVGEFEHARHQGMKIVGSKIKARLNIIRNEYQDWIRDCTMRVDGMAMATQWAQGETNVEIALATKRDSRYMRSIALLTMIFLPGTFLAGIFSMTFFDWKSDSGGVVVSKYVWIYVLIAVVLTLLTVGSWYYFSIFRPKRVANDWNNDEDEDEDE